MRIPFDKVVDKIAALGVPGLVLLIAVATSGYVGGAAIVVALSALGGPLGMVGGIGLLIILALIAGALAKWGIDALMSAVLRNMKERGVTKEEILKTLDGYWFISGELNRKLRESVELWYPKP